MMSNGLKRHGQVENAVNNSVSFLYPYGRKRLIAAVASKAHVHAAAFSMREDSYFYCVKVRKMGNYPVIDPVATGINIDGMRRDAGYSVAAMAEYFGFGHDKRNLQVDSWNEYADTG